ncbi:MAG TPA: DUF2189 domain-containing protein [Acetobacteraceae bacterium]|nr:DUF2189 domain-containing protein [Acetobacteraceae bacterium]
MAIRSPIEWGWDQLKDAAQGVGSASTDEQHMRPGARAVPAIRRIRVDDLRIVLRKGLDDFAANRTDVIFLCVIYPVVGLMLAHLAFGHGLLPLLFPFAAGFALVGPVAAIGLNEMSRRRELGESVGWTDAFGVLRSPSIGAIVLLSLLLIAMFLLWMAAASVIYRVTLGPGFPTSAGAFVRDVFTTSAGWALIALGVGVGFLFAVAVLAISVISFPMLLDRNVRFEVAVATSMRAVRANPGPMAAWGVIVAAGLVLGSIPFLLGLAIVLPVLGHATWHLYRRLVPR